MPRNIELSSMVLAFSLATLGCSPSLGRPPVAVITPIRQRAVAEPVSNQARAVFRVTNHGGRDLILGRARSSCSCSVASIEPNVIPPGMSGTVTVEGTIKPLAEKLVSVAIDSNTEPNGLLSFVVLLVGAKTTPLLLETPPALGFGIVAASSESPRETFEVRTLETRGSPPWLTEVVPSTLALGVKQVDIHEVDSPEDAIVRIYRYEASFPAETISPGEYSDVLAIYSGTDDNRAIAEIPVSASVRPAVFAAPARVRLLKISDQQDASGILMLECLDPDLALLCETVFTPAGIDVLLLDRRQSRSIYRVTARSDEPIEQPATLAFQTNHRDVPRVEVEVSHPRYDRDDSK